MHKPREASSYQKCFQNPHESLAGLIGNTLSLYKPVYTIWERGIMFQMCKCQQKVMASTNKQGNMTQTKEWNKSTKTERKDIDVYELPHQECKLSVIKVLNEIKKSNVWTKWEYQ